MPSEEVNEIIDRLVELAESNREVQDALLHIVFDAYENIATKLVQKGDATRNIYDVYEQKAERVCEQDYRRQFVFVLSTMTTEELFEELDIHDAE